MDTSNVLEMDKSSVLEFLPIGNWQGPFASEMQNRALAALEAGKVIVLEKLPFTVNQNETGFLNSMISGNTRKNISFDPHKKELSNVTLEEKDKAGLAAMMDRFGSSAFGFLKDLLSAYAASLERARTSFRPNEIKGRSYSPRQDDRRAHVDAFPSRPSNGRRILRFFTNIAPDGAIRHWQVGEAPFNTFAQTFRSKLKPPMPGSLWLLETFGITFGITKGRRSLYDHYMLQLHDGAKLDSAYQMRLPKTDAYFKPGTSWFCFTDQVLHAAISGHTALEQTFYVPVKAMADPSMAPLRILENMVGHTLV